MSAVIPVAPCTRCGRYCRLDKRGACGQPDCTVPYVAGLVAAIDAAELGQGPLLASQALVELDELANKPDVPEEMVDAYLRPLLRAIADRPEHAHGARRSSRSGASPIGMLAAAVAGYTLGTLADSAVARSPWASTEHLGRQAADAGTIRAVRCRHCGWRAELGPGQLPGPHCPECGA